MPLSFETLEAEVMTIMFLVLHHLKKRRMTYHPQSKENPQLKFGGSGRRRDCIEGDTTVDIQTKNLL